MLTAGPDSSSSTATPWRLVRSAFAASGAMAAVVAWSVTSLIVRMAGLEGSQPSVPHGGSRSAFVAGSLLAAGLAVGAAVAMRTRPRLGSLLGATAVLSGVVASMIPARISHGYGGTEAGTATLVVWLFMTSPLDVSVIMGFIASPSSLVVRWCRPFALAFVGLSAVVLALVMFPSSNASVAWGALIVWLLVTLPITVVGVRGADGVEDSLGGHPTRRSSRRPEG